MKCSSETRHLKKRVPQEKVTQTKKTVQSPGMPDAIFFIPNFFGIFYAHLVFLRPLV
jgi:hypothetical protein